MRYSKQREIIYNIVKSRCDHPTADMIYASAREVEPSISLGTVYRNLKSLVEGGEIDTLETVDKKIHYDGNTDTHIHFICESCGEIEDFFIPLDIPSQLKNQNLTVTNAKCVYYGLCNKCKKIKA